MTPIVRTLTILLAASGAAFCAGCQNTETPVLAASPAEVAVAASNGETLEELTVQVARPERTALTRQSTQPATVHANHQAEIHARVAGYLKELHVDIGDSVQAGQILGELDVPEKQRELEREQAVLRRLDSMVRKAATGVTLAEAEIRAAQASRDQAIAEVRSAQARLNAANTEFERVSELVSGQSVAARLGDEARERRESAAATHDAARAALTSVDANVAVAEARLGAAQADLDIAKAELEVGRKHLVELETMLGYAQLKAPFAGIITARNVDLGDLVSQADDSRSRTPLLTVSELGTVRVRVSLPERDAAWADRGDRVTVHLRSLSGQPFQGTISRTARSLDPSTRTMVVEIDLPNSEGRLAPGMFGEATIALEERADQLVLPAGTVRYDETGRSYVYTVRSDNTIAVVEVVTGLDDGRSIEIVSGLDGSENVVTSTIGRLKEGQRVRMAGADRT